MPNFSENPNLKKGFRPIPRNGQLGNLYADIASSKIQICVFLLSPSFAHAWAIVLSLKIKAMK